MNAANLPETIDHDEVVYDREDVGTEANIADKHIHTKGKRHGSPAANSTQMQSLASGKKRQKVAIDDKNSSESEIQETKAACFRLKKRS